MGLEVFNYDVVGQISMFDDTEEDTDEKIEVAETAGPGGGVELYNGDCLEILKKIQDNTVDLVITDPPYEFNCADGGGCFGNKRGKAGLGRDYHAEYVQLYKENKDNAIGEKYRVIANRHKARENTRLISKGFDFKVLDECCRVMKKINIYVWCSKAQVRKLLDYFEDKGCFIDILTWHKTNPIPTCNGTYLNDTEYCIFAREKGVKVYGSYKTKFKYYVTPLNSKDKKKYKHPTIKPLDIINNLVINSSQEGDTVLDCFMGSGTTGVASKLLGRKFIGIEIDETYFDIAQKRIYQKSITSEE